MTNGQLHHQDSTGSSNLRRVFVRDLELMARVGVYEVERRYEQRIVISVELSVIDDYDGVSDKLRDVFDYGAVVKDVQTVVEAEHVHLLETLAERISRNCLADPRVQSVRVRIEKPDILPGCHSVGIEIERRRAPG
jgi:7,8-dihydroneopterin aldolase/epimerase/oxygenase